MSVTALLRLPDVIKRTGLSRSEIYRREAIGQFPRRVSLGARSVAWPSEGVQSWIEARIRESRGGRSNELRRENH
jgi:prophage regulatory protein